MSGDCQVSGEGMPPACSPSSSPGSLAQARPQSPHHTHSSSRPPLGSPQVGLEPERGSREEGCWGQRQDQVAGAGGLGCQARSSQLSVQGNVAPPAVPRPSHSCQTPPGWHEGAGNQLSHFLRPELRDFISAWCCRRKNPGESNL